MIYIYINTFKLLSFLFIYAQKHTEVQSAEMKGEVNSISSEFRENLVKHFREVREISAQASENGQKTLLVRPQGWKRSFSRLKQPRGC